MKWIFSHLLALAIGALAAFICLKPDKHITTVVERAAQPKSTLEEPTSPILAPEPIDTVERNQGTQKRLSNSDLRDNLEEWVSNQENDQSGSAKAQVIAGLITDDMDRVRQGIEADPNNPELLFIGSTLPAFSDEERLEMSTRLLAADPDNALAGYIAAAHQLEAGETETAIEILKGSEARHKMSAFRTPTQLSMDDAFIAAGFSPTVAKFKSAFNINASYITNLRSMTDSLQKMSSSMPPEDASELRSITAEMGLRLAGQSRSGTVIDHLAGIAMEQASLKGLPDDAESPYEGLTVSQAREALAKEDEDIKKIMELYGNSSDQLMSDPELMSRYIDRFRLMGEADAMQWLASQTQNTK